MEKCYVYISVFEFIFRTIIQLYMSINCVFYNNYFYFNLSCMSSPEGKYARKASEVISFTCWYFLLQLKNKHGFSNSF